MADNYKKYPQAEKFIQRYEELKKKLKSGLTSNEELEYFEVKEIGKSYKRYKECLSSVPYLRELIRNESDKELCKIYSYDLEKIEDEIETLQQKIEKELDKKNLNINNNEAESEIDEILVDDYV